MGLTGQSIALNASGSWSFDGPVVYYHWDFGDGTSATEPDPTHQYSADGVYTLTLTVCDDLWNCGSSETFVTAASVNLPVRITFDDLSNGTVFNEQSQSYLNTYGVRFYSANALAPAHTHQVCGQFCSTTSLPNFISTKPDDAGILNVEFTQPVSNLSFYMIGVDTFWNQQFAVLDVYRGGAWYATYPIYSNGTWTRGVTLSPLDNISKIVIRGITDTYGIGFDDFTFSVPSDIKITSGRVGGYLNGTTQNALLGADVALQATPLPNGFAGGTYSWTCTPAGTNLCSIIQGQTSSGVTLRMNELGVFNVTVSYAKAGTITTSSMTINSILPTLTSFTAQRQPNSIWAPFTCGNPGELTAVWRYRNGCHTQIPGIDFMAKLDWSTFISDPTKSGVKYVQAYSTFHKIMSRGIRCETSRSSEADVASGWEGDRQDPTRDIYTLDSFMNFSGLTITGGHLFRRIP